MRVIVTGAAGHIGRAISRSLVEAGLQVVAADRDEQGLAGLVSELDGDVVTVPVDVTDPADSKRLVADVVDRWGRVDACVAGAGIEGPIAPVEELDPADVEAVFRVNALAVLWLAIAVVPTFKAQSAGRFIPIASGAGLAGAEYGSAYHASKHAVVGITRSLARELAPFGVSVNAVCPGFVESPMMERISSMERDIRDAAPDYESMVPAGRMAQAEEVAAAVKYLVADAPGYLNGTCMVLDGGLRA